MSGWVWFVHMSAIAGRNWNRILRSLELEMQMAVRCLTCFGEQNSDPLQDHCILLAVKASLHPQTISL